VQVQTKIIAQRKKDKDRLETRTWKMATLVWVMLAIEMESIR
jgi:hypothetical protein